jgi:hypothetical protein
MIIDEADLLSRSMSTVTLDKAFRCADLTQRRALTAGVTGAMTSGADYGSSHALADSTHGAFDGILWRVRHDLAQRLVGVALFGPEGEQGAGDWPPADTAAIDHDLAREAEDEFGYRIMPAYRR